MDIDEEIENLNDLIYKMAGQVEKNLFYALDVYLNYSKVKVYEDVDDDKVNDYERCIEEKVLNLMLKERLFASDIRTATGVMSMVQDLERLGDHAKDVLEFSLKLKNDSSAHKEQIRNLVGFVILMVKDGIDSYIKKDVNLGKDVISRDDHVDKEYASIISDLIKEDKENKCTSEFAIYTTLVVKYLERIADHATNVAEWAIYILTGYYKDKQII